MFHHLFEVLDLGSILVQLIGVTFIILPAFVASSKKSKYVRVISLLNGLMYALIDLSAFISKKSSNDTVSLIIFIGAWILWAVILVLAIAVKSERKK